MYQPGCLSTAASVLRAGLLSGGDAAAGGSGVPPAQGVPAQVGAVGGAHQHSGSRGDGEQGDGTQVLSVDSSGAQGADPGVAVAGVGELQPRPCTRLKHLGDWSEAGGPGGKLGHTAGEDDDVDGVEDKAWLLLDGCLAVRLGKETLCSRGAGAGGEGPCSRVQGALGEVRGQGGDGGRQTGAPGQHVLQQTSDAVVWCSGQGGEAVQEAGGAGDHLAGYQGRGEDGAVKVTLLLGLYQYDYYYR